MKARPTVAIAGLGLVGGSLARALLRAGWRVIGIDRPAVLRMARRAGAVTTATPRFAEAVADADVVVLAAPPAANLRLLRRLARRRRDGQVITDVGSVKGPICREARRLGLSEFVGGHPMAGRERSGFEASTADLFSGRPWIFTPLGRRDRRAHRRLEGLARAARARPATLSPEVHDRVVAYLSHVPQLVAWALVEAARRDPAARRHLALAGPGFRDMTRLAASPRRLWRQILAENARAVARAADSLVRALGRVRASRRAGGNK